MSGWIVLACAHLRRTGHQPDPAPTEGRATALAAGVGRRDAVRAWRRAGRARRTRGSGAASAAPTAGAASPARSTSAWTGSGAGPLLALEVIARRRRLPTQRARGGVPRRQGARHPRRLHGDPGLLPGGRRSCRRCRSPSAASACARARCTCSCIRSACTSEQAISLGVLVYACTLIVSLDRRACVRGRSARVKCPRPHDARPRRQPRQRSNRPLPRLRWWRELITIGLFYGVYTLVRNQGMQDDSTVASRSVTPSRSSASSESLGVLPRERPFKTPSSTGTASSSSGTSSTGRPISSSRSWPSCCCSACSPERYPTWRNTLAVTVALALLGFAFYPLMPPRLSTARLALRLRRHAPEDRRAVVLRLAARCRRSPISTRPCRRCTSRWSTWSRVRAGADDQTAAGASS